MRSSLLVLGLVTMPLVAGRAAAAEDGTKVALQDTRGASVGEAILTETPHGVFVTATLHDLPPGEHGFHIHERGQCVAPFTTAGGHFNPRRAHHGYFEANGPHQGDLPNVVVPESGSAKVEFLASGVTLKKAAPGSLLDPDGSALVVHAGPDDYRSDPAGNSGDRIACGVIGAGATEPQAAAPHTRRAAR